MASSIFPKEFLDHTSEYHLARISRSTQALYLMLVLGLIMITSFLPFLFIDVSVKSSGMLKASTEMNILKSNSSGLITKVYIKENDSVEKGQLLFEVQSPTLLEKEKYLVDEVNEVNEFLDDLKQLINSETLKISWQPATSFYRQSLSDYRQKLIDRQTRYQKVKQDYDRNKKLFDQGVIAATEFENFKFEFEKAQIDLDLLRQGQLSNWQQELHTYAKELAEDQNQLDQTLSEKEARNIKAPVSGTIQNMIGIYAGTPVFANQDLAQISPDTSLLAEVYVSPNDIGLLREGMDVHMQIGAFNYNQWGLLHGKIDAISNDIQMMNDQPFFEIRCSLDQDHLSLKNGYKGKLKKGMTLQARFVVTKRSLWQLLYDKVDDWMNPNILK